MGSPCTGRLDVDGREVAVLRKTHGLAFSYELLYQWLEHYATGSSQTWTTSWRSIIGNCKCLTLAQQEELYKAFRLHFMEATMDFIQLQQLDYHQAFSCDCYICTPCLTASLQCTCGQNLTATFLCRGSDLRRHHSQLPQEPVQVHPGLGRARASGAGGWCRLHAQSLHIRQGLAQGAVHVCL